MSAELAIEQHFPFCIVEPDSMHIKDVSSALADSLGHSRAALLSMTLGDLVEPGDVAALRESAGALDETAGQAVSCRLRRAAGELWPIEIGWRKISHRGSIAALGIVQHVSHWDVTQRKRAERRLRSMLDELDHRVSNTLTTVQALAHQSLIGSAVADEVRDRFEGRLLALSLGHKLLARQSWEGANLRELIEQVIVSFAPGQGRPARFTIEGDDTFVGTRAALALAMMFQELASNAAKYGALSDGCGYVEIHWQTECGAEGTWLKLRWQERGGPRVIPPVHRGFGTRLIQRSLAHEIDGEVCISYEPGGAVCEVAMPLTPDRRWS